MGQPRTRMTLQSAAVLCACRGMALVIWRIVAVQHHFRLKNKKKDRRADSVKWGQGPPFNINGDFTANERLTSCTRVGRKMTDSGDSWGEETVEIQQLVSLCEENPTHPPSQCLSPLFSLHTSNIQSRVRLDSSPNSSALYRAEYPDDDDGGGFAVEFVLSTADYRKARPTHGQGNLWTLRNAWGISWKAGVRSTKSASVGVRAKYLRRCRLFLQD
eukprot:scaffold5966_cov118-Cylindrotheca_fusiformis.AAC.32